MAELSLFFPNNKKTEYVKRAYEVIKMCWEIHTFMLKAVWEEKSKEC